jgi:hypothetical protein
MEVVLLWLDDLDDACFSVALAWERICRAVLQLGLASAVLFAAMELLAVASQWTLGLWYVAAASVVAWTVGTLSRALYRSELVAS